MLEDFLFVERAVNIRGGTWQHWKQIICFIFAVLLHLVELGAGVRHEHGDGLGVEAPVVPLLGGVLVGVVDHPALFQDLGSDPLRLHKQIFLLQFVARQIAHANIYLTKFVTAIMAHSQSQK
jgi:hypothetical protein